MALMKMPTNVGSGGGMRNDSGSTSLSTTQNTRVELGYRPKIIHYNTKDASGTGASYYISAIYTEGNNFDFNATLNKEVCYLYYGSSAVQLGNVGDNPLGATRGALLVVDDTGFTCDKCDGTGYGTSLNWEAWG